MKFLIINSFRSMVYVAYIAIIVFGVLVGVHSGGRIATEIPGVEMGGLASFLDIVFGLFAGWLASSLICGLIVTILDIRDDLNDRLPEEKKS